MNVLRFFKSVQDIDEKTNFMEKNNIKHLFTDLEIKGLKNIQSTKIKQPLDCNLQSIKVITKSHSYDVFKIVTKGQISYYAIDIAKFVGSGSYGAVYEGFNILTQKTIVAKYGQSSSMGANPLSGGISTNEVTCLKKTGLYIAFDQRKPDILLMHRAPGRDYESISLAGYLRSIKTNQFRIKEK